MALDPAFRDHQAWLGYLQPDGLVVSPAALVDLQVILPRDAREEQQRFLEYVTETEMAESDPVPAIADLPGFLRGFLGWPDDLLFGLDPARPLPEALCVPLPEFGEILEPKAALVDAKPKDPDHPWLLLVQSVPAGTDLDAAYTPEARGWSASPGRRFERLLRECQVPIGLLANGTHLRLLYAPRGENAGSLTFPVAAMTEIAGRAILAALHMLLKRSRLLAGPVEERLPAVLAKSREYQSTVSTRLSGQVLEALYELLRGFQAADERTQGELLKDVLAREPDTVYAGLLNVLLRLVFLLYAEDRGLMPGSPLYVQHYSVHGLFEKLRADAQNYPDTMDHRYGAWARLLALFRAVHGGCRHPQLQMPARQGYLFDPERFLFLEGRSDPAGRMPLLADGVVWRVLDKLLMLGGERLSYRTLDVEQIGSVYETIMGFCLEVARGPTIALRPAKKHGAPPAVNLETLLAEKPANRAKWLRDTADQKLDANATRALKAAESIDDLLAALERRIARGATPSVIATGAMVLQPNDERRRSGSHYTPRSLTEPIVHRTLEPVLARLGSNPTPEQILDLKVCDLAVGSGAFLVAACRELGDALVEAWHAHDRTPEIPPDEDEVLLARRLVAQCCLYGLDKNPMAADLAKLSLWLATLARDHPFTFLDHAIRAGDSLVGLRREQLEAFHWKPSPSRALDEHLIRRRLLAATAARREILDAGDDMSPALKAQKLTIADESLELLRLIGDLVIAAFFSADKAKDREMRRQAVRAEVIEKLRNEDLLALPETPALELQRGAWPVSPFHWEIEYPEVFQRDKAGFDAIVGNPPFLKGGAISSNLGDRYRDYLLTKHERAHGNSDLVAYFFRDSYQMLQANGAMGLIATKTIAEGDTRATGLQWIRRNGGTIYNAVTRLRWPGTAAVTVSTLHIAKSFSGSTLLLDGRSVQKITAFLLNRGEDEDPAALSTNANISFEGSKVYGQGFLFDDQDLGSTPLDEMRRLVSVNPENQQRIFPYISGIEVNSHPSHKAKRYVIDFRNMDLAEAAQWPELLEIVERKVKPERVRLKRKALRERWWVHGEHRPGLYRALEGLSRVLVNSKVSQWLAFVFVPTKFVYSHNLNVFALEAHSGFSCLQSRVHEVWVRFASSTLEDRLGYRPTDCFETFPFVIDWQTHSVLDTAGKTYHDFRANLMVRNNEGLTATYNHFHDPEETSADILKLRDLHAAMDRAVLDAYGWSDIPNDCEFLLEWEDEDEDDTGRRRKKPWRLRWPDDVRDEVLARLLALNAERAAEEERVGLKAQTKGVGKKKRAGSRKTPPSGQGQLGL